MATTHGASNNKKSVNVVVVNTVIVGGGHCGCNFACRLEKTQPERSYIVLEQSDCLLPKWKYSRWQDFQLNSPIRFSKLYGEDVGAIGDTLDRPLAQDIQRWEDHIAKFNLKHQLHASVTSVERNEETGDFVTTATITKDDGLEEVVTYQSKNVLAANGLYARPKITQDKELAESHPEIKQIVPFGMVWKDLQPGGVLIVGGGQTGVQLADLLANKMNHDNDEQQQQQHRPIAICTSKHGGAPRYYRGRDVFYWLDKSKFLYMPKEALETMPPEKAENFRYSHPPVIGATTAISPFSLRRKGVEILGGLEGFQVAGAGAAEAVIRPNRAENVQTAVMGYKNLERVVCEQTAERLEKSEGHDTPFEPHVPEPEWVIGGESEQDQELMNENGPLRYNLTEKGITNIIWATGSVSEFGWLKVPAVKEDEFDQRTRLPNDLQSKAAPGLFFSGFPWVGHFQSANIINMDQDHAVIASNLRGD